MPFVPAATTTTQTLETPPNKRRKLNNGSASSGKQLRSDRHGRLTRATPEQLERARRRKEQELQKYASTQETISATPDDLSRSIQKRKTRSITKVTDLAKASGGALGPVEPALETQIGSDTKTRKSTTLPNPQSLSIPPEAALTSPATSDAPRPEVLEILPTPDGNMVPSGEGETPSLTASPLDTAAIPEKLNLLLQAESLDADQLADLLHNGSDGLLPGPHGEMLPLEYLRQCIPACTTAITLRNAVRTVSRKFMASESLEKLDFIACVHNPNQEDLELFWRDLRRHRDLEDLFDYELQTIVDELYPRALLKEAAKPPDIEAAEPEKVRAPQLEASLMHEPAVTLPDDDSSKTSSEEFVEHAETATSENQVDDENTTGVTSPVTVMSHASPLKTYGSRRKMFSSPMLTSPRSLRSLREPQILFRDVMKEDRPIDRQESPLVSHYSSDSTGGGHADAVVKPDNRVAPATTRPESKGVGARSSSSSSEYRKGPLSEAEYARLEEAVKSLMKDRNLTHEEFCQIVHTKQTKGAFWPLLVYCLPKRHPKNVREFIRKTYTPRALRAGSPFQEADLDRLRLLVNEHGRAWSKIGRLMGRYREDCQHAYLKLEDSEALGQGAVQEGAWTETELQAYARALATLRRSPDTEIIDWDCVARQVGTRTPRQCRDHGRIHTRDDATYRRRPRRKRSTITTTSRSSGSSMLRTPLHGTKPSGVASSATTASSGRRRRQDPPPPVPRYSDIPHRKLQEFVQWLIDLPLDSLEEFDLPSDLGPFEPFGYDGLRRVLATERKKVSRWRTLGTGETLLRIRENLGNHVPRLEPSQEL